MGCIFRLFFILLILTIIGGPIAIVVMAVDKQPLIAKLGDINIRDLQRAKELAQRYDPRTMPADQITHVQATTDELNTLLKGGTGVFKQVATRVQVSRFGVIAVMAFELPIEENPLGRFVNVRGVITPSNYGLRISRLAIGALEVPDWVIEPAMIFVLDRALGHGKGKEILSSIKSVAVRDDLVTIAFKPPPRLIEDIKLAAKNRITISDPKLVRIYFDEIYRIMEPLPRKGRVSMLQIMRPVFRLARERSARNDPVSENEAAILALSMVLGDPRFEQFVGEVRPPGNRSRLRSVSTIRLDGRHDFVQHFSISAGLTITGGDVAANIIGELKEVKDSEKKSGFSFTDIGADRTGVIFAKMAVSNNATARKFQDLLANALDERVFFPAFKDLPEGMPMSTFKQRYGDVNSPAYKRVIADIDSRINRLPIYR